MCICICSLGQNTVKTEVSDTQDRMPSSTSLHVLSRPSPCDDSLLHVLKTKDSLTQADIYYTTQKEKECIAYSDSLKQAIQDSISQPEKEAKWQKKKQGIIAGIVLGVIGNIALIVLFIFKVSPFFFYG
jgi:hypothetical protein